MPDYRETIKETIKDTIKDSLGKLSKQRIVLGFDISDEYSVISYYMLGDNEPKTATVTPDGEDMCIPTVIGKSFNENVWHFGSQAIEMEQKKEGMTVDRLLEKARAGENIQVEMQYYDPVDLLALFMKKCFGLVGLVAPVEKVAAIVITVDKPDEETMNIFKKAVDILRIKPDKIYFQSHSESAYYYMINQPRELWNHNVLICHLKSDCLVIRTMKKNVHTSPVVVLMEENKFRNVRGDDLIDAPAPVKKQKDNELWTIMQGFCEGNYISSIYLMGKDFEGDWWKESLNYMSKNRRVFMGNNLFSKGAAYGAREIINPTDVGGNHVFLGREKVKANVGMNVIRDGAEVYMALLDAGKNWYDTRHECDLILDREEVLTFVITPLNGKNVRTAQMYLTGIPLRNGKSVRIHLTLHMKSERKLIVTAEDRGFGEFFESSGLVWNTEIMME